MEIERKFLLSTPDHMNIPISECDHTDIQQKYIKIDDVEELRIRMYDNSRYELTQKIKTDDPVMRHEVNINIPEEYGNALWNQCNCIPIHKVRYFVPDDVHSDMIWSVDIYKDDLEDLVVVEIEFPDSETAHSYETIMQDITDDPRFKNAELFKSINTTMC